MTPRLKTALWVQALLRRVMVDGAYGAIIQKGGEDAGAVQLVVNRLDGTYELLSPPPGPAYNEDGERCFVFEKTAPKHWPDLNELLQRRRKRDPDLWIIEIEMRIGFGGVVVVSDDLI